MSIYYNHLKKVFNKVKENRYVIFAWIICYIIMLATEWIYRNEKWVYDAYNYWTRGSLLKEGQFWLGSIDGFRGYIFPLFLGVINSIGGVQLWYIINALFVATFVAIFLPQIYIEKPYQKSDCIKVVFSGVLLALFETGLIAYPLSDLFAVELLWLATLLMKKAIENNKIKRYMCILGTGIFCYLAYNVRTIYLFASVIMFVMLGIKLFSGRAKKFKTICVISGELLIGVLGTLLAAIPQIIMNYINLGKLYIGVPTNGLMLNQVYWGMELQRYDTYVGKAETHTNPQMFFLDPSGIQILEELNLQGFNSWLDWAKAFAAHPIDMIIIYVRHFINFIFPCWPQMYVKNLNSSKWIMGLLGATLLFVMIYIFLEKCLNNYTGFTYYVPLLIPALLIIPGAVEYRFSLPFYLFAICQICFNTNYKKIKITFSASKTKIIFLYLIFISLVFAIWSNMLGNESASSLLF